jgi:hypothetical protein
MTVIDRYGMVAEKHALSREPQHRAKTRRKVTFD